MQHHLIRANLLAECLQTTSKVGVRQAADSSAQQEQRHVPLMQRATEPSMAHRGMQVQGDCIPSPRTEPL